MKFLALAAFALLSTGPSTRVISAPQAPSPFSLTLEHRGNTWAATCATGCSWKELSVTCAIECAVIVDDQGMLTAQSGRRSSEKFAFLAEPTPDGWDAHAYVGTAWESLSRTCAIARCRGKVSELGVSAP